MGYLDQVWSQNGWILAKFEVYKLAKKEQASGPYIAGGQLPPPGKLIFFLT